MPPKKVAEYYMQMNEVAYDLIDILQKQRDSAGIYHNVTDLSFRWALECEFKKIQQLYTCSGILDNLYLNVHTAAIYMTIYAV